MRSPSATPDGMRWCLQSARPSPCHSMRWRFWRRTGSGPPGCCRPPVFSSTPLSGPTFGVVQNVVDQRRRATATAILYICLSVLALGGGPLFTGWVIDRFAERDFHAQGIQAALSVSPASFAVSCPGGAGIATASAGIKTACNGALARATRRGLLLTLLFFGWASVHYLLAATGIVKSTRAAAASGR